MTQRKHPAHTRSRTKAHYHHQPPHEPPHAPHRLKKLYPLARRALPYFLILACAAVPFALGKYIEFNSPGPFDSGSYVYSAWRAVHGAHLGVDEKPSAQLGTLLVNMLGVTLTGRFSETGPKLIQLLMQAGALVLMAFTLKHLVGIIPAALAVFITAAYLSAPALAKFGNVKEQYMIAVMIAGLCCFLYGQIATRRRAWIVWTLLAGALLVWAPLFKPTGVSALAAVGLFTLAQPLLKLRPWKQMAADLALLLAGAVLSMAPVFIWMQADDVRLARPYSFVTKVLPALGLQSKPTPAPAPSAPSDTSSPNLTDQKPPSPSPKSYVAQSRKYMSLAQQAPKVFRFYKLLILPVALALLALALGLFRALRRHWPRRAKTAPAPLDIERFLPLLALWWLLDMAFVWISPRSYEQYYLPLNASAAMLGAFPAALLLQKALHPLRPAYLLAGLAALVTMTAAIHPIFAGIAVSPHTGTIYTNRQGIPEPRNGYKQRLNEIKLRKNQHRQPPWETTADYIRQHSTENDKIYVWGWYPGIYVKAQRLAPTDIAFYATMHSDSPAAVRNHINHLLADFAKTPPRFIVDSQKPHFPFNAHPVFDLWPCDKSNYMPPEALESHREQLHESAEKISYAMLTNPNRPEGTLSDQIARETAREERARHEAMFPLRQYVMENYRPIFPANAPIFLYERKAAVTE